MPANGFSCSERLEAVAHRDTAEDRHHELVVIDGDVGVLEAGCHLELARRHLVVARDDGHAKPVEFALDLREARHDALRDSDEIVVLELLAARGRRPDQRSARHHEVGAL